jgi:hypothetical protein
MMTLLEILLCWVVSAMVTANTRFAIAWAMSRSSAVFSQVVFRKDVQFLVNGFWTVDPVMGFEADEAIFVFHLFRSGSVDTCLSSLRPLLLLLFLSLDWSFFSFLCPFSFFLWFPDFWVCLFPCPFLPCEAVSLNKLQF